MYYLLEILIAYNLLMRFKLLMEQTQFHGIGFSTGLTAFLLTLTVLTLAGSLAKPEVVYATNSTQNSSSGANPSLGGNENTKSFSSSAHCDRPGYPSCSSLGFQAGQSTPGTSCPPGHSKAFCNAYEDAAGNTSSNNQPGQSPQPQNSLSHCGKSGYPACYSLGYADGRKHPGTSCPPGHSQSATIIFSGITNRSSRLAASFFKG
jgi:hypothetical protein